MQRHGWRESLTSLCPHRTPPRALTTISCYSSVGSRLGTFSASFLPQLSKEPGSGIVFSVPGEVFNQTVKILLKPALAMRCGHSSVRFSCRAKLQHAAEGIVGLLHQPIDRMPSRPIGVLESRGNSTKDHPTANHGRRGSYVGESKRRRMANSKSQHKVVSRGKRGFGSPFEPEAVVYRVPRIKQRFHWQLCK